MSFQSILRTRRRQIVAAFLLLVCVGSGIWSWQYSPAQNALAQNSQAQDAPAQDAEDAALQEKLAAREKPERAFAAPLADYSLATVDQDADYYTKIRPARAWQHAEPLGGGERFPPLTIVGEMFFLVLQHNKLPQPLQVEALPGRPVTFTATDGGHFSNEENSITVKADQDGLAKADFWVADAGDFYVWVGSPENEGPVEFIIQAMTSAELLAQRSGQMEAEYEANKVAAQQARAAQRARLQAKIETLRAKK